MRFNLGQWFESCQVHSGFDSYQERSKQIFLYVVTNSFNELAIKVKIDACGVNPVRKLG